MVYASKYEILFEPKENDCKANGRTSDDMKYYVHCSYM